MTEVIPLWLRDVYAKIEKTPIYEYRGKLDGIDDEPKDDTIFISADNIFAYCSKNNIHTGIVTIVINNLRDLYWDNRATLPTQIVNKLRVEMNEPSVKFRGTGDGTYQLFGNVTPYDILHVPVSYFIESLNRKLPIEIMLNNTNTIIRLDYENYDFYDIDSGQLIEYIPEAW